MDENHILRNIEKRDITHVLEVYHIDVNVNVC